MQRQTRQERRRFLQELTQTRFIRALRRNDTETLQDAIDQGADVNQEFPNGNTPNIFTPLGLASVRGNVNVVRILLHAGADVNRTDSDGYTALHLASIRDQIEVGCLLLALPSVDVDKPDNRRDPYTALQYAVARGSTQMTAALVAHGANVDVLTDSGLSLVDLAQNLPILVCLRQLGFNLCQATGRHGLMPLHRAALNDNLPFVEYLATHTDVDAQDQAGYTAFHRAVTVGNLEICRWLVEEGGANPRLEVEEMGVLHLACSLRQVEIAVWLLDERSFSPHEVSQSGAIPLTYACVRSKKWEESAAIRVVLELLNRMDDVAIHMEKFVSSLSLAACWSTQICQILIERCTCWSNVPCGYGILALNNAVKDGTPETVSYLVSVMKGRNWDLDIPPFRDESTALHVAVASKNPVKVLILLDAGCSVHATNRDGQTPLDVYVINKVGNLQLLQQLLDKGADPTRLNSDGHPPLCDSTAKAAEVNLMAHAAASLGFFTWGVQQRKSGEEQGRERLTRRAKSKAKERLRRYR